MLESPMNSGNWRYKRVRPDYFNITMTYRRDSDVFIPYDDFHKIEADGTSRNDIWHNDEVTLKKRHTHDFSVIKYCNVKK